VSLKGNPQRLRDIGKNIAGVGQVVKLAIAARVAPAITELALASFDRGETPYGEAWSPGYDGRDVDLYESGAIRGTLRFISIGGRVRCVMGVKHAKFQVGKRRVLPAPGQTMPASWRDVAGRISREEISLHLAKVA
jgi:hypothetical protein